MDGEGAPHVRAHRRHRQLLLHRAVVPEDRGARGHGLEHAISSTPARSSSPTTASTTCGSRCRAAGWSAQPGREQRAPRQRRRHDDAPLRPGGRARLRVDDEPRLRRAARAVRASGPAAGRHAPAAAARARGQAERHFDGHARDAAVLRRVVRRVSVRAHHDRRPGVAERRGRHGIPDALHRRHALARARRSDVTGGRHRARGRSPVLVRAGRQQRVRARVDGRRASTRSRRRASIAPPQPELPRRCGSSAGSCRGCSATCRSVAPIDGTAWRTTAARPRATSRPRQLWRYWPGHRRQHHLQQDGARGCTRSSGCSVADAAARHVALLRSGTFTHPTPEDFFTARTRAPVRT